MHAGRWKTSNMLARYGERQRLSRGAVAQLHGEAEYPERASATRGSGPAPWGSGVPGEGVCHAGSGPAPWRNEGGVCHAGLGPAAPAPPAEPTMTP